MPQEITNHPPTIGILHAGDLGSAVAKLLRKSNLRVVTTCKGRSQRTCEQAKSSGMVTLASIDDVISQSDIVLSLVLPESAFSIARKYADLARLRPTGSVFVDANSIDLEQVAQIERLITEKGIPFLDAAIHGSAQRLEEVNLLYLSGPNSEGVAEVFEGVMKVTNLGGRVGDASRMKLIISAMSKTLAAMFLEIGALAEKSAMLEPFLETCHQFYPGIMSAIERTLPTYPRHASRRADQLRDIENFSLSCGLSSGIIKAAGERIEDVASVDWTEIDEATLDIQSIIRTVTKKFENNSET